MRGSALLLGSTVLAFASGCTTSVGSADVTGASTSATAGQEPASATATAVVVVEGSTSNDGARTEAVARFIKARSGAVDDEALRMVGATVDFPAVGGCAPVVTARAAGSRTLALLDVGGVTLFAGDAVAALQPRQLPDVADLVSGVVYSARSEALPSKSDYLLRIDGTPESDVTAFVVAAASPGEPTDVRLGGDDGRTGAVSLALAAAVDLTWEAGSGEDAIYVDVTGSTAAPLSRCLFADTGRAKLPSSAFGSNATDGTVAVHRLHRESFRAHGVDPGEVRFDFARVVSFTRR
jgi:hypothetical protein